MIAKIQLVGHRGQPCSYPENSLEGFKHILQSGAAFIEADVNLTADDIVVLSHDENLYKLTGKNISITRSSYHTFKTVPAGYSQRFSNTFTHSRIATLKQFTELLKNWPKVTCFIELKRDSSSRFGSKFVDLVIDSLQAIIPQSVLISFDYDMLVYARNKHHVTIGWVLSDLSRESQIKAEQLSPGYLFIKTRLCPQSKAGMWPGPWQWVVYTINDVNAIQKYANLGIKLIETDCYSELQPAYDAYAINHE